MKRYRKIVPQQPAEQDLLVLYAIRQWISNYRFKLLNRKIKMKYNIREIIERKKQKNIDKHLHL